MLQNWATNLQYHKNHFYHINTIFLQAAAQQAQANAAAAAAKAAAAGLGGHKDATHEGTAPEQYQAAPQKQEQDSQEYYHQLQSDYHH